MSLGETLRLAREEKGQTISQVAEATRMMVQIVEDLEREDFRRIAAPIYGRGFIKLYAEHLGLDAEPLIREFMEIYTGSRPPQVVRRTEAPSDSGPLTSDPGTLDPRPLPLASSLEPDLFSVAAGRSEAVRSVADPAQPGEASPPRVRPAAPIQPDVPPSAPGNQTARLVSAKNRAGGLDATRSGDGRVGDWLPLQGTPAVISVVVVALLFILALAFTSHHKRGDARHAKPAAIRIERVLPPIKPYFD